VCCQLENELSRCQQQQKQLLRQLIDDRRRDISSLWDKCYVSSEEQDSFSAFTVGELYTQLYIHEHSVCVGKALVL